MLRALIWDVDGTLAETEEQGHRIAFNEAFAAAGLPWHWDPAAYRDLLAITGGKERLRAWWQRVDPAGAAAPAHLDKHRGPIRGAHDQVDFTAAAAGRPIIALQQPQSGLLQMVQGGVFGRIAHAFGAGRRTRRPVMRKNH